MSKKRRNEMGKNFEKRAPAVPREVDPHRFRVTLLCPCDGDVIEGYGPTVGTARATAEHFLRKHLIAERPGAADETVEEVTPDGSHYVTWEDLA
jgi:hypothetical protein